MKNIVLLIVFILLGLGNIVSLKAQNRMAEIKTAESEKKITLEQLEVRVLVTGNIATTTLDMLFFNPNQRILEGELNFPLSENQTVTRYALDINGKLREAVVVEKNKGRQAFEQVVNQRIDPGLLEMTRGNNFKSRIYPIPPNGHKRVVVAYEQELIKSGNDWLYQLPLSYEEKIPQFSLRIEVAGSRLKPELSKNTLTNFRFKHWQQLWMAETKLQDFQMEQPLTVQVPLPKREQVMLFTEKEKQTADTYFYLNTLLRTPPPPPTGKHRPESVTLLWDVSGSEVHKNLEKELSVLRDYLAKANSIRLVTFSHTLHEDKVFPNWKKTEEYLQTLAYDGATQLGQLDLTQYGKDETILCTDGLSTFGEHTIKAGNQLLQVINSNTKADHSLLQQIAWRQGGQYINLQRMTPNAAYEALVGQPFRFISATYPEAEISEVYPSESQPVNQQFALAGIMKSEKAEIQLHFGYGNTITHTETIQIKSKEELPDNTVKKLWAKQKLAQLNRRYEENKEAIAELGKKMNIVTRNSSLIVLDRIEDYVQYEIVPPVELQDEYFDILAQTNTDRQENKKQHIEGVVADYQERIDWWKRTFDPKPEKKKKTIRTPRFRHGNEEDSVPPEYGDWSDEQPDRMNPELIEVPNEVEVEDEMRMSENMDISFSAEEPEPPADIKERTSAKKGAKIKLKNWEPQAAYMDSLRNTPESKLYDAYLALKPDYINSPSFYLDVSGYFIEQGRKEEGLRILSNTAEMELENPALYRMLGHRLRQVGAYKLAIKVFEQVLEWREEHPQSYRDLAMVLAADGQYQKALNLYWEAISKPWNNRFPGIEATLTQEMNALIATCDLPLNTERIDQRLLVNLPVDLRVVLNWSSDYTDMDLWVIDPREEVCKYSNETTVIGGRLWNDFTQGLGPEEFWLKEAIKGIYKVKTHYYSNNSQQLLGPVVLQLEFYTHYGSLDQKKQEVTLRLESKDEVIPVGEFSF